MDIKVVRNKENVTLVDMVTFQRLAINNIDVTKLSDEEIIKQYKSFCVRSENRRA